MSPELKSLQKEVFVKTLAAALAAGILIWIFWPSTGRLMAVCGLLWGICTAFAGFCMICALANSLTASPNREKVKGAAGYTGRYVFYAVVLFLGAILHFSLLTMILGFLLQKGVLVWYALEHRKD